MEEARHPVDCGNRAGVGLMEEATESCAAGLVQEVEVPGVLVGGLGRLLHRSEPPRLQVPRQLRAVGTAVRRVAAVPTARDKVILQELGRNGRAPRTPPPKRRVKEKLQSY